MSICVIKFERMNSPPRRGGYAENAEIFSAPVSAELFGAASAAFVSGFYVTRN